ncbi:MAG: hypothetical protein ABL994_15405 [Verrucomicrobiales bacterium]
MEDWDGDGDLELVHEDEIDQPHSSHASQDLYLVNVFEPKEGKWAVVQAFIGSAYDPKKFADDTEPDESKDQIKPGTVSVQKIDGDFSSDGVPDSLVVEMTTGTDVFFPERCELRLVQENTVLYQEEVKEIYQLERFQIIDLDKDGAQEVLVWFSDAYWHVPKAYVYGTPQSQWKAKNPLSELRTLGGALNHVRQTRAKLTDGPAPVSATVTAVSSTRNAPDENGFEITTYRFRVELTSTESSEITDLKPWRDYFMKWGVGFVSDDATSLAGVEQARKLRWSVSGDSTLEFETEFPRDIGWIGTGQYSLWLECSYAQRAPNSFGWSGTVITPGIPVEIDTWRNIEDER